jgi:hypothetical protein
MKYWAYLAAKLCAGAGLAYGTFLLLYSWFPPPPPLPYDVQRFGPSLAPYFTIFIFCMFCGGILYLIILDQRYRCRTCLRRLRMPIVQGNWTHVLLGPPRTEYICPYGHGTLKVPELQITGSNPVNWQPHEDMWKELASLEESKKA